MPLFGLVLAFSKWSNPLVAPIADEQVTGRKHTQIYFHNAFNFILAWGINGKLHWKQLFPTILFEFLPYMKQGFGICFLLNNNLAPIGSLVIYMCSPADLFEQRERNVPLASADVRGEEYCMTSPKSVWVGGYFLFSQTFTCVSILSRNMVHVFYFLMNSCWH